MIIPLAITVALRSTIAHLVPKIGPAMSMVNLECASTFMIFRVNGGIHLSGVIHRVLV